MEKITNGSGEPIITIRASLKKLATNIDKDLELVVFVAEKKKIHKPDADQTTLDRVLE